MSYSPAITRCLFLLSFLPVSSWQRHFLSDWQVFCIVTLKSPLNSTKSDTLSLPGQTWSTLTQYSSHSLWSWAGGGQKTEDDPFPSLTMNAVFFFLHGCDWPDPPPHPPFFSFITASEKRSEVHNWIRHCLRGAPFNWVSWRHGWLLLLHDTIGGRGRGYVIVFC